MQNIKTHTPLLKNTRKQGFSLVEILIVIALIAVLATVAIGNLGGIFGGQQEKIAQQVVNQGMKLGLTAYKLDVGNYPSTEEGLMALIKSPAGKESRWKGPYIEEFEVPLDPWGNAYQYRFPGSRNVSGTRGYDIWSLGTDGTESPDDIGNWK
ncbi:MAG: type II secretion system major pseudopilin GspG [Coraliomargaritaceae bacterium]